MGEGGGGGGGGGVQGNNEHGSALNACIVRLGQIPANKGMCQSLHSSQENMLHRGYMGWKRVSTESSCLFLTHYVGFRVEVKRMIFEGCGLERSSTRDILNGLLK